MSGSGYIVLVFWTPRQLGEAGSTWVKAWSLNLGSSVVRSDRTSPQYIAAPATTVAIYVHHTKTRQVWVVPCSEFPILPSYPLYLRNANCATQKPD